MGSTKAQQRPTSDGVYGSNFAGAEAGSPAGWPGAAGADSAPLVRGGDALFINDATDGRGGGGAGGAFDTPGGGVGLEGIGANGIAVGGHGSRANASVPVVGGGGTTYNNSPQRGMHGGVRIIWGAGRTYPNNAQDQ